jgi:hypothetical protein
MTQRVTTGTCDGSNGLSSLTRRHDRNTVLSRLVILGACVAGALADAAWSSSAASSDVSGFISIQAGSNTKVITVGNPTNAFRAAARWHVTKRIVLQDVRPLWRKADGSSLKSVPAYRRRQFTAQGDLVGRAVDIVVKAELWASTPRTTNGIVARISLDDFLVSSHKYESSWGRISSIEADPNEIGRLPAKTIVLRAGRSGVTVSSARNAGTWRARAGKRDVVRLAGCAFGMSCSYDVSLTCFAPKPPRGGVVLSAALAPSTPRSPAVVLAAAR